MTRALFFTALVTAACAKSGKAPAKDTPGSADPTEKPPTPGAPTPTPTPTSPTPPGTGAAGIAPRPSAVDPSLSKPGPAYLGIDDVGVVMLDGGRITKIVDDPYTIQDLAVGPKGEVWVIGIGGLWKIEGTHATKVKPPDTYMSYHAGAVGPDGVLWLTDQREVARFDGKAWTTEPADTFDNALLDDITVDKAGRVWVSEAYHLWRLDGAAWTRVDTSFTGVKQAFFSVVVAGPSGEVYTSSHGGTFYYQDNAWHELAVKFDYSAADHFVIGADARIAATSGVDDLVLAAPGDPGLAVDVPSTGAKAHRVEALAVDGQGRTWLTTDNGVVILDKDYKLLQQWEPGTVAGISGKVAVGVVIGAGPTLPPVSAAAVGTITGKVLKGGKAVGGAEIELCESPLTMFHKTPCESATLSRAVTSAADGTFTIANVPVGSFGFAVKPAGQWIILIGSNCCTQLPAGGSFDVGAITLD